MTQRSDSDNQGDAPAQELASQLRQERESRLRLAADFDNYRKRVQQELLDNRKYAATAVAERLLPILDDAERVLEQVPEGTDEVWLRGLQLTVQKLKDVLSTMGVKPIEAVGHPFDPKLHEAIATEESDQHPEGTVLDEIRRGYRVHDRVLRPSLVKLARRPAGQLTIRPGRE